MELSIDTSSENAGIAISDKGRIVMEYIWNCRQNHTVELVPNIEKALKDHSLKIRQMQAVFVAMGPGSFNGVRVGISAAKGFAMALDVPLVAVSTLEIEAYAFAAARLPIRPVQNAGRGEIATSLYQQRDEWDRLMHEYITTTEEICRATSTETVFCGEIPALSLEQIQSVLGKLAVIPDEEERRRRPRFLAELAWKRLCRGILDDPVVLQPIYLRQPPITMSKKGVIKK
ncbi:MAG TPA: tRNA (adenosine(37)-N6)-threonylcarbamoyltransferase complex dimerization subunit type 1 TsaB [Dehalococcoidia bacterium]|nr:tRNA (adenosine(37)-N6)-threonylcarbamoyltransferase complex dimerization subunit type 1 TsaB [Dehalococcoidia bacterium]